LIFCAVKSMSADPDPLVFLDLLGLYHSLGMKADFALQSGTFSQHFNCTLPEFAKFSNEGHNLESYSNVMSKIVRLWPSRQALVLLDHCIYRGSAPINESFDLAAFRDLLTLHTLAEVVATTDDPAHPELLSGIESSSSHILKQKEELTLDLLLPLSSEVHSVSSVLNHTEDKQQVQQPDVPLSPSHPGMFESLPGAFFDLDNLSNADFSPETASEDIARSTSQVIAQEPLLSQIRKPPLVYLTLIFRNWKTKPSQISYRVRR